MPAGEKQNELQSSRWFKKNTAPSSNSRKTVTKLTSLVVELSIDDNFKALETGRQLTGREALQAQMTTGQKWPV